MPDLVIESGELFELVDNNGAGKTTFFRLILDLVQATEGRVLSGGKDVAKDESWKRYTGSYLDEGFIIDFLPPEEFFQFVGTTYEMSGKQIRKGPEKIEAFFNGEVLGQGKKKDIRDFSKGNIQKIGIAAAMLPEPKVLVLDEPVANFDPTSQIARSACWPNRIRKSKLRFWFPATTSTTSPKSAHGLPCWKKARRFTMCGRIQQESEDGVLQELEAYFAVET